LAKHKAADYSVSFLSCTTEFLQYRQGGCGEDQGNILQPRWIRLPSGARNPARAWMPSDLPALFGPSSAQTWTFHAL